jgi:DNA gyrase/topoisomerase IV subunit A
MMGCMDSRQRAIAEDRLRVLELLEAAMERRDEVLEIVDSSEDADEAQERIRQLFAVSDPNISQAVLDQQVSRWTRSGRQRLAEQAEELRRELND